MVPKGWTYGAIEQYIELVNGFAFKSSEYTTLEHDIKLLRGDNITSGSLRWKNAKRWPKEHYPSLNKFHLNEGDIVIAMDRTWVSSGLKVAPVTLEDLPCLLVQRVSRVRAKNNFEQSLLKQIFIGHQFEQYVKSVQTETAVPHISPQQIRKFPILVPPLPEQQKIAQILSTWDKAIATTEKLLTNSQQQKKALMQQLLTGKRRLLDEWGIPYKKRWEKVKLGDVSFITTGVSNREDSILDGEFAFFDRSEDIRTSNQFLYDTEAVIVPGEGQDFIPKHFSGKFDLHQRTYAIMDFKNSIGKFIYYYIHYFRSYFLSQAVGSTVKSLRLPMFQKMPIHVPSLKEQTAIANVLSTADKEIDTLKQKLSALKQEKQALMQQLLTGKRRVKVEEAA
ncbi:restriction endonuclease subunit S [Paraneptunicella aestuarii]|uniref:restriction endonuclease subunit S n=1 Tax=Paraneptunicella aestuarii TaxID=2831148 RepID=UPI001E2DAE4F|nr:restriction endonuclease subunit S [Paraneptunicella aestuarii]UAA38577.1 restriction endonuclease subunit S [Paraneptunicella aestuarii]